MKGAGRTASAVALAAVLAGVLLCEHGVVKVPMPHPADDSHFERWPDMPPFNLRRGMQTHADMSRITPFPLQQHAVRLFEGHLHGVETVTVDPRSGRLILPDKWGDVYTAERLADGSYALDPRPLAQLGTGRVLGNRLDAQGRLVMCDVLKGLLRLDLATGQLETLASVVAPDSPHSPGSDIFYANGLDIARNGTIFFTSSTDILPARSRDGSYDTGFAWVLNNFRGLPNGRVLAYDPATRAARVVAAGFYYSDGVAVADDGSHLLVVETDALRVLRVWLEGPRAGERDVVIDRLPGLPAGLSRASDGNYWVSMTVPVPPYSRFLSPVLLRAAIAWLPRTWRPPVKVWGAVVKISPEGRVLQSLLDPTGARVATASAATEAGGRLFLGSIMGGPFVSYVDLDLVRAHGEGTLADVVGSGSSSSSSNATAAAGTSAGAAPPAPAGGGTWEAVGGWSLHEQQDLWSRDAHTRTRRR